MSSIGGLFSTIEKAVSDPGEIVKEVCDQVLPKNLAVVGDAAAAYVDVETGHEMQALGHGLDALRDLPQALGGPQHGGGTSGGAPSWQSHPSEPSPPPGLGGLLSGLLGGGSGGGGLGGLLSNLLGPLSGLLSGGSGGGGGGPGGMLSGLFGGGSGGIGGMLQKILDPAGLLSGAAGSGSASAASSTPSASASPAASGSTTTSSSTSAPGSTGGTPTSLSGLMSLSNDQFMQMVTSGKIPPDVQNNQAAMMQVQQRLNQISQMNQMMTQMMQAAHQMQMAIIQNFRV